MQPPGEWLDGAALAAIARVSRAVRPALPSTEEEVARAVAEVSHAYTRERGTLRQRVRGRAALAARLRFFLPRDLPKITAPLGELERAGCLPSRPLRVLDVGAGLGTTSLGVARYFAGRSDGERPLDVLAVDDDDEALAIFSLLARERDLAASMTLRTRTLDLTRTAHTQLGGPFDLIVAGLVVNELFAELAPAERALRRAEWLVQLATLLAEDGALVVLEPALRDTARALQQTRDVLVARGGAPFVFSPCLHSKPCPMLRNDRDWCHDEIQVPLPPQVASLAKRAGLRHEDLTFSHLTLRRADAPRLAGALRLVSASLRSKGKTERFGCTREGELVKLVRLTRDANEGNDAFEHLPRGACVSLTGAEERGAGVVRIGRDTEIRS